MVMTAAGAVVVIMVTGTPGAVPERLDDRGLDAEGAFHLESRVGDMIRGQEVFLDPPEDLRLTLPVGRFDVEMG